MKVARHGLRSPSVDPDAVDRAVREEELDDVRAFIAAHIPGLAGARARGAHVCLYTVTPDEHFVLDLDPGDARIAIASPCSGHGFKFAPAIGKILAELVTSGRAASPAFEAGAAALFSARRFASR